MAYNNAVANANNLQRIETSPYFTGRLTEAQLEEERKKAERKAFIKVALEMLADGFTPEMIVKYTKQLDIETIRSLIPQEPK